jgi:hypothetical protein
MSERERERERVCVCVCVFVCVWNWNITVIAVDAVNVLCLMTERDGVKISGGATSTEGRNIGWTKNVWKERGKRKGLLRVLLRQQKGT